MTRTARRARLDPLARDPPSGASHPNRSARSRVTECMTTTTLHTRSKKALGGTIAGIFVLIIVAIALLWVGGGLMLASTGPGTSSDKAFRWLLVVIGLLFPTPIAVIALVQAIRTMAGSATAHRALAKCATATGSFALAIGGMAASRGSMVAVGVIAAFGLVMFGCGAAIRRLLDPSAARG